MFLRTLINILLLMAMTWGSYNVMIGNFFIAHSWQYYVCLISPWVLVYGSIRAWHRCLTWRRMSANKDKSPYLSRGLHRTSRIKQRSGILEHACFCLFLIAVAAIFKQLGIDGARLWIGSIIGLYFMLHLAI
jgi:hypothetical protein